MRMLTLGLAVTVMAYSNLGFSDPATYDASWQWNKNVSIEKVRVLWNTDDTRIILSNGETCRIVKADKELFSVSLAMRAQGEVGEVVCQKDPIGTSSERRAHRITF